MLHLLSCIPKGAKHNWFDSYEILQKVRQANLNSIFPYLKSWTEKQYCTADVCIFWKKWNILYRQI